MKRVFGFFLGLTLALLLTLFAGENPWNVFMILVRSAFGSMYDLGLTLSYTTPLIFCGLSVAIGFHAGLFNIGAEGQLTMAVVTTAAIGVLFPQIPFPLAPVIALLAGLVAAGLWGWIAGWLRAVRGSHEVIITIMMNFIAAGLASWFTLKIIPNPESQNPETAMVAPQYMFKDYDLIARLFPDTPANASLGFAVVLAVLMWIFLWKTTWGFELRAVGSNPEAAHRAGISEKKVRILAMTLAGVMAGFVALSEVLGSAGQYRIGFSPDYGFIGIAVALLASNNPLGIIVAAFLMGALHKGASDLDLETTTITRDFSRIIQALVILGVVAQGYWEWIKIKRRKG
ncbi:ABC transporter permease [Bdellovibrio bacteriovorus]|uniref:ABC-type ribose transporter, permease protein n=1 Tax=Bdellovibrio bacteriovorus str. Tiberius TaxID=1069642 RepID=K7YKA8_BDEBC|nr:ABC transporter permease [Bdellovibrio bacteriovorus]AFY00141.1 ABC-type ribose transporter, permease protein [Bdellovibrio bacteriovorus str. Tiberius]